MRCGPLEVVACRAYEYAKNRKDVLGLLAKIHTKQTSKQASHKMHSHLGLNLVQCPIKAFKFHYFKCVQPLFNVY